MRDLFGRENYEYYARLTGRILKVEDEWIFFTYPPVSFGSSDAIDSRERGGSLEVDTCVTESRSIAEEDLVAAASAAEGGNGATGGASGGGGLEKAGSLEIIPENCPLDPNGRLSISLDDKNISSPSSCGSPCGGTVCRHMKRQAVSSVEASGLATTRRPQRGSEIKSYTCLPQVRLSIYVS